MEFLHRADLPNRLKAVAHRIPQSIEPPSATARMLPLFMVQPLGVLAHEKVVPPLFIRQRLRDRGSGDAALAAANKFSFGAFAALKAQRPSLEPVPKLQAIFG